MGLTLEKSIGIIGELCSEIRNIFRNTQQNYDTFERILESCQRRVYSTEDYKRLSGSARLEVNAYFRGMLDFLQDELHNTLVLGEERLSNKITAEKLKIDRNFALVRSQIERGEEGDRGMLCYRVRRDVADDFYYLPFHEEDRKAERVRLARCGK